MSIDSNNILGVILAGGLSSRMNGQDKTILQLGGKQLIEHVADRLCKQVDDVIINTNGDETRFNNTKLAIAKDTIEGFAGPLAGILAGMKWAQENTPTKTHILSVAADTPFFPTQYAKTMSEALDSDKTPYSQIALVCEDEFWHPTFGLWPTNLANALEDFLMNGETRKVMAFVKQHELVNVVFKNPTTHDLFFNINRPEDIKSAEQIMSKINA